MWHYRDTDPDFGQWQAKELLDHMEGVLTNEPVEVVSGNTIVEVKPQARTRVCRNLVQASAITTMREI